MKRLMAALLVLMLALAGCGGGGSSDPSAGPTPTSGTTIIAVDPYIVGAVFQEVTREGVVVQTSTASDELGQADFTETVTEGNTLVMITTGMHNGVPFNGVLKRTVDASGELVISPLTTLMAGGMTAQDVSIMLAEAGIDLPAASVTADPMAALASKDPATLTEADLQPLIAAMAVNAALNTVADPTVTDFAALMMVVADTVLQDSNNDGTPDLIEAAQTTTGGGIEDIVGGAVAVTDYLVRIAEEAVINNEDPVTSAETAATDIDSAVISALVEQAVADGGQVVISGSATVPPVVEAPLLTIREYLDAGYDSLAEVQATVGSTMATPLIKMVQDFQAAKALIGLDTTATQQDEDEANFFGGIAGLLTVADPYSDLTENGLNNLGDFLDILGVPTDNTQRSDLDNLPLEDCQPVGLDLVCTMWPVLDTMPTTGPMRDAMTAMLAGRLQQVDAAFALVSSSFLLTKQNTEYDYADSLFLKGLAQAMRAQLHIMQAYDLDVDVVDEIAIDDSAASDPQLPANTVQAFLGRNSTFLALDDAAQITAAKAALLGGTTDMLAAMDAIEAETDDQSDDLVSFYAVDTAIMATELARTRSDLEEVKAVCQGQATVLDNGTSDPSDDETLNYYKFFDGIDLRSLMPTYTDDTPGLFPDPTLGGFLDPALVNIDINEDVDGDGSPDLILGYTNFFSQMLDNQTTSSWFSWDTGYAQESFTFNANGTASYSWDMYSSSIMPQQPAVTGNWVIEAGDVVITFASPVGSWRSGGTMDEIRINMVGSDGEAPYFDAEVEEQHYLNGTPVNGLGAVSTSWFLYPATP